MYNTSSKACEGLDEDLDKQQYVGAVIMDFSKAFGCLPHDLTLAKLSTYVLSANTCDVLSSYLSNRK